MDAPRGKLPELACSGCEIIGLLLGNDADGREVIAIFAKPGPSKVDDDGA
jgi:hypothetical protein